MPIVLRYILVIFVVAALVTIWALAVTRWKKWSGGCGMCSMVQGSCCKDLDADGQAEPPKQA